MKIAVVHNHNRDGTINRFGRSCPERYSLRHVQMVADAVRELGHTAAVLEADILLFEELGHFMPADPVTGCPTGMVFNMAYGIQGDARYTHLPAMLEMAGIPYTGSNPLGHALALDKVVTKILMVNAGVPTPAYRVMSGAGEDIDGLNFPLVVKPRHESTSYGLQLARERNELDAAVTAVVSKYRQEALVEEYVDGREICIGLLGNGPPECLPPVELDFGQRGLRLMTWDDKYHRRLDEPRKICPAALDEDVKRQLDELALATFRACHVRDYARVDIRIDPAGRPFVLEINSMASLGDGGSYVTAAKAAGYDIRSLVGRILEAACQRYSDALSGPADSTDVHPPSLVRV